MGIRPGPDGRPAWVVVLSICYWESEAPRLSKSVAAINFGSSGIRRVKSAAPEAERRQWRYRQ